MNCLNLHWFVILSGVLILMMSDDCLLHRLFCLSTSSPWSVVPALRVTAQVFLLHVCQCRSTSIEPRFETLLIPSPRLSIWPHVYRTQVRDSFDSFSTSVNLAPRLSNPGSRLFWFLLHVCQFGSTSIEPRFETLLIPSPRLSMK